MSGSAVRIRRCGVVVLALLVTAGCEQISRVSRSTSGAQGNGSSTSPAISDDGRFVAFASNASNLVSGDTNATSDAFVHDAQAGTTTRVSVSSNGGQGNGLSAAFEGPALSGDGRFVAFTSAASNLVAGDTNGLIDVFVRDLQTGTTTREAVDAHGPTLSDDGRFLAYVSGSQVVVRDRQLGSTEVVPSGRGTEAKHPDLSGDGRFVAMTITTAVEFGVADEIWLYDRRDQLLDRLSYLEGNAYWPSVSDDGRTVTFGESGGDAAWIVDRGRVSPLPGGLSYAPEVSDDGRFVVYRSENSRLVSGDTNDRDDVFVLDRTTGAVSRASVSADGTEGNDSSDSPVVSADGRHVAFASRATNLVPDDTNGVVDVFRRDRGEQQTTAAG
ncbi:MAG TPA: hypothetical protein VHK88_11665 [Aquihabitans sp.]|jgi:Tol biopolymer transport system component|nr:hypothetical protein [Aquihabitans sp.]